jgi:hypothetical protein
VLELALKTLELEGDYKITFMANYEFNFLPDPDDIIDYLDLDQTVDEQDLLIAIEGGVQSVTLPAGYRLVGLLKKGPPAAKRVYGVVDFSSLGAM